MDSRESYLLLQAAYAVYAAEATGEGVRVWRKTPLYEAGVQGKLEAEGGAVAPENNLALQHLPSAQGNCLRLWL